VEYRARGRRLDPQEFTSGGLDGDGGAECRRHRSFYRSTHCIKFSELDPYDHVRTGTYATYYVDHRMEGLREYAGWDLKTLGALPFMVWVRRMEIDFLRPARGDQEITITSFVREFRGPDALSSAPWSTPPERRSRAAA
jgi:hypothetical protein